jgi:hypothetical protein
VAKAEDACQKPGSLVTVGLLSSALLLVGCAAAGPERPAVGVGAPLAAVDPGLVVGTWECRDLNPYPGQPEQVVASTYRADGGFEDRSVVPGPPPGGAAIEVANRGRWAVEGGRIVTREVRVEATARGGDLALSRLAALSAEFMNGRPAHERDGAMEVLELGPSEMLLRPIGVEDPAVLRCVR